MAQASDLSRYRPAVLAVTGLAALWGVYLLYSTHAAPSRKTTLRRSNAVHRPHQRGGNSRLQIVVHAPVLPEAPLGCLEVSRDDRHLSYSGINLAARAFPTIEEISGDIGPITADEYRDIATIALRVVLEGCLRAQSPAQREQIARYSGLPAGLASRDPDILRELGPLLTSSFPTVNFSIIQAAIEAFLQSDAYLSAERSSSDADLAETDDLEAFDGGPGEPSQGIKGLLYYIAEDDARRKAYEHRGIQCEECGDVPIRGVRWHCLNCPDFDLCSTCEPQTIHPKTHVFVKIKIPLPFLSQPNSASPLYYPGDPRRYHAPLDVGLKKRISEQHGFEQPKLDALYDQFTCLASVSWSDDPSKLHAAIDRHAFNTALTSDRWSPRFPPNIMYDRMWNFYDSDHNGMIGFEEFVSGLSYLRGPKRFASLDRALDGFDIDGDGFLDRADFLRLFRAKYSIQKQLVSDMVDGQEAEQTGAAMDVLRSSQPISSVFNQEEIPQGEDRPRRGKQTDEFGDMRPLPGTKTILKDDDPWLHEPVQAQRARPRTEWEAASQDRLRHHLSRFEEMLYDISEANPGILNLSQPESASPDSHDVQTNVVPHRLTGTPNGTAVHAQKLSEPAEPSSLTPDPNEVPIEADALWKIVEDGFSELLDPIFKTKEDEHANAISTRAERERWQADIKKALAEKQAFQEELRSAAMIDPLMATALHSVKAVKKPVQQQQQQTVPRVLPEIVATDAQSLARREKEISQRPLEDLLSATGYSTIDAVEKVDADASEITLDPTLPHNRPDAAPPLANFTGDQDGSLKVFSTADTSDVPTRDRLEYLGSFDDIEREIKLRGGPGRLSFDEIEAMAQADTTKEIRGLITCWLEFAGF